MSLSGPYAWASDAIVRNKLVARTSCSPPHILVSHAILAATRADIAWCRFITGNAGHDPRNHANEDRAPSWASAQLLTVHPPG